MGGTVTPDTFVVRKTDVTILDRQIADKQRMTITAPQGAREVDVPRMMRTHDDGHRGEIAALLAGRPLPPESVSA